MTKIIMLVGKGMIFPADETAREQLRALNYKMGQEICITPHRMRDNGTWKHAHNIGKLCIDHIDEFSNYHRSHDVLKRIQLEGNIACTETMIKLPADDENPEPYYVTYRVPRSLSFDEMDEDEFRDVLNLMYKHLSDRYLPECDSESVEILVEAFGDVR